MNEARVALWFTVVLLLIPSVACEREFGDLGLPDRTSDTGYEGTWQRGNERVLSILSIVRHEGRYLFRHTKLSADGRVGVTCGWDGRCEEISDGEKAAEYTFDVSFNDATERLRVECNGEVFQPTPTDVHYVDELVVLKEGLLLRSWVLEDINGQYEFGTGPYRDFRKVSDHVLDPPEGWRPREG